MAFFHHGTIRKYTAAILNLFNDIEIQYNKSSGESVTKAIPLKYSAREKARIFDKATSEQLLSGNYNVLPRASLSLNAMQKAEQRVTNKNIKINKFKSLTDIDFSYNSVPYEFNFEIIFQCRGMNEVSQIIEQIVPMFNPTVNIDVWDVENLSEPTRIPITLMDVQFENEEFEEISSNIFTVIITLGMIGNIYPPIKSQERIQEFKMAINEIEDNYVNQKELLEWDVHLDGHIEGGTLEQIYFSENGSYYGTPSPDGPDVIPGEESSEHVTVLCADKISIDDYDNLFDSDTVEGALKEIGVQFGAGIFEKTENKGQPNGYAPLDFNAKIPAEHLPSYVDDVEEYNDFASLPELGWKDKIYVTLDSGNIYRWTGTSYIRINNTVTLSEAAIKLETAREIALDGEVVGSVIFDGTSDVTINTDVPDLINKVYYDDLRTLEYDIIPFGSYDLGTAESAWDNIHGNNIHVVSIKQPILNGEYNILGAVTTVSDVWNSAVKMFGLFEADLTNTILNPEPFDIIMADENGIFRPTKFINAEHGIIIDGGSY